MKIGIMSDLHMEFSPWNYEEADDVDIYINAGDIATANIVWANYRTAWLAQHPDLFYIYGNHDYYKGIFTNAISDKKIQTIKGIKIAGAVLWTDLTHGFDWSIYCDNLNDRRMIAHMDERYYHEVHQDHKKFLLESEADIIVSHTGPSYQSVAEEYKGSVYNCCFVTELGNDIVAMKNPPKLWIHGHTHKNHDYMIGNTRVICHPRGYPGENPWFKDYQPLIVEI
jgi:predicted phosphodiesterase